MAAGQAWALAFLMPPQTNLPGPDQDTGCDAGTLSQTVMNKEKQQENSRAPQDVGDVVGQDGQVIEDVVPGDAGRDLRVGLMWRLDQADNMQH